MGLLDAIAGLGKAIAPALPQLAEAGLGYAIQRQQRKDAEKAAKRAAKAMTVGIPPGYAGFAPVSQGGALTLPNILGTAPPAPVEASMPVAYPGGMMLSGPAAAAGAATALGLTLPFLGGNGGGMIGRGIYRSTHHTTPSGRVVPSRVALIEQGDRADFFVHAGLPKTWSKVTLKSRRCRPRCRPR